MGGRLLSPDLAQQIQSSGYCWNKMHLAVSRDLEIQAFASDQTIHKNTQPRSQVIALQQSLTDSGIKLVELLNHFSDCISGNLLLSNSSRDRQQESRNVDQGHERYPQ